MSTSWYMGPHSGSAAVQHLPATYREEQKLLVAAQAAPATPCVMDWWKAISGQQKLLRGQTLFLSQFSAYKQVTEIPPQHALPLRTSEAHFREIDGGSYKWLNLPYYVCQLATTLLLELRQVPCSTCPCWKQPQGVQQYHIWAVFVIP